MSLLRKLQVLKLLKEGRFGALAFHFSGSQWRVMSKEMVSIYQIDTVYGIKAFAGFFDDLIECSWLVTR